ncbi:phage/plasmid replication protein, II/X family [Undibacterium sp. Ji50W]|uniref:phage/plasmid replication protein, II/X family n=1 Tax=Undibacterium sp. Ji50W TaxID=3413041 RepID=UPI003BF2E08A
MNLPLNTEFNIDTVSFSVKNAFVNLQHLNPTYQHVTRNGEDKYIRSNRTLIAGANKRHRIAVRYDETNKELEIEGALYAFLYGQNVYTTSNLKWTCLRVLEELKNTLGTVATSDDVKATWKAGHLDLNRVDIAVNFRFKSKSQVHKVLQQVALQLNCSKSSIRRVRTSIYWCPEYGKKFQIVAYAKGPQMQAKNKHDVSEVNLEYMQLMDDCENVLRIELRLYRAALKELGLSQVLDWKINTPRKIFAQYFERMHLLNVLSGPLTSADFDSVTDRMKPVIALLKLGANMDKIYSARTLARHRTYFRKKNIDISVPTCEVKAKNLGQLLSSRNRVMLPPNWLTLCKKSRSS